MTVGKEENNLRKKISDTGTIEAEVAAPEPRLVKRHLKEIKAIFVALTYRDYRYFWTGAFLSSIGTWLQTVALGWLVYEISKSAFLLGFINFAGMAPVFVFAIFAGVAADRFNRRNLILLTQVIMMITAFVLGAFTTAKIATIPSIAIISFASGIAFAFNFPAWQAIIPDLVPRRSLLNAIALSSAQFNSARLIGPAIAGVILAAWGAASCFYLNGVSFLAVVIALLLIKPNPNPKIRRAEDETLLTYFAGGLRYAKEHLTIGVLLITVGLLTIFGTAYTTLMPIFAKDILHVGRMGLGLLLAATGLGAAFGALIVSYLINLVRNETLIKSGPIFFAGFLIAFTLSRSFILSLVLLAGVGASLLLTLSTINTSIQAQVPNEIRGRIMSLYVLMFLGMVPFSSIIFGGIAEVIGASFSIAIGAAICLLVGLILTFYPTLIAKISATAQATD